MTTQVTADAAGSHLRDLASVLRRGVGRQVASTAGYNVASNAAAGLTEAQPDRLCHPSCSSRPVTPPFVRSRILLSRTAVLLLADAGEQVLAFRDFNPWVKQATRLLTRQGLIIQLGGTAISSARRDDAVDPRMAFILEKLV